MKRPIRTAGFTGLAATAVIAVTLAAPCSAFAQASRILRRRTDNIQTFFGLDIKVLDFFK